jgi:hypothetical protein
MNIKSKDLEYALEIVYNQYRKEIRKEIIKFCKNYGFNFVCGNGIYLFIANKNCIVPKTWITEKKYNDFGYLDKEYVLKLKNNPVAKFINELESFNYLLKGYLTEDYME